MHATLYGGLSTDVRGVATESRAISSRTHGLSLRSRVRAATCNSRRMAKGGAPAFKAAARQSCRSALGRHSLSARTMGPNGRESPTPALSRLPSAASRPRALST